MQNSVEVLPYKMRLVALGLINMYRKKTINNKLEAIDEKDLWLGISLYGQWVSFKREASTVLENISHLLLLFLGLL